MSDSVVMNTFLPLEGVWQCGYQDVDHDDSRDGQPEPNE